MAAIKLLISTSILIASYTAFTGCKNNNKDKEKAVFPDSEMYNLSSPTIINLPIELDEISGIAYYEKDTSVFAIIDEDGLLFKIPINDPSKTKKWVFDKPRDYEDIILKDSVFYVLVSNGDVESLHFEGDSIITRKSKFSDISGKKLNEFESIYLDSNRIIIMCKECEEDKKAKISFYWYNDSLQNYQPFKSLDVAPIAEKLDKNKIAFKPSAAAINPVTKELYILSAIHKMLLIIDISGQVKDMYSLNPKIYKQPEGIAFTPAGDLIISNEVFLENHATLLILKNKKK
jgi:uncharacterized protein YjiK